MHTEKQKLRLRDRYGPWAVVTGASSGIGREIAWLLADAGLHLILVARSKATLETLATSIATRYPVKATALAFDLAQANSVDTLSDATRDVEVGLLIAAAGFGTSGAFIAATRDQEVDMLNVNCRALLLQCLHFGNRFAKQQRGGIVLLSSVVGFQGVPQSAHYAATKAYVQTLAEALHLELKPLGVDVVASAPGPTHSGFAKRANMTLRTALDPKVVAVETLTALGWKATVLPGALSKLIGYSLAFLPRWARVRTMGRVMDAMVNRP